MNKRIRKSLRRLVLGVRSRPRGQSFVELAGGMAVLSILLFVTADFSRMFYTQISVKAAARAGVQYAVQSLANAADTNGITAAVSNDASNIALSSGSPTVSQCTCISTATTVPICSSSYNCSDNPGATYVTVSVSAPFHTMGKYPGLANPIVLSGTAKMQVMQ